MIYLGENAIGLNHMISQIGSAARIECGAYTPTEDESVVETVLNHSLGVIPDFLITFIDPITIQSYNTSYLFAGAYYSSYDENYPTYYFVNTIYNIENATNTGSMYGGIQKESAMTSTTFTFPHTPSATTTKGRTLKANTTYHYIIGKFNEQEVTAND